MTKYIILIIFAFWRIRLNTVWGAIVTTTGSSHRSWQNGGDLHKISLLGYRNRYQCRCACQQQSWTGFGGDSKMGVPWSTVQKKRELLFLISQLQPGCSFFWLIIYLSCKIHEMHHKIRTCSNSARRILCRRCRAGMSKEVGCPRNSSKYYWLHEEVIS